MNKAQRKVSIDLNIKAAHIKSAQRLELVILWKRGIFSLNVMINDRNKADRHKTTCSGRK